MNLTDIFPKVENAYGQTFKNTIDGGFTASWQTSNYSPSPTQTIFLKRYDGFGQLQNEPISLSGSALGWDADADELEILGLDNGQYLVLSDKGVLGSTSTLTAQFINPNGSIDSTAIDISNPPNSLKEVSLSALENSRFIVSWRNANDDTISAQVFTNNGVAETGIFYLTDDTSTENANVDIQNLSGGSFVATWTSTYSDQINHANSSSKVNAQIFDENGAKVNNPINVTAGHSVWMNEVNAHSGWVEESKVVVLGDNSFFIIWRSEGIDNPSKLFAQKFDATGNKIGTEIEVSGDEIVSHASLSAVKLADDKIYIEWKEQSENNVLGVILDQNGARDKTTLSLPVIHYDISDENTPAQFVANETVEISYLTGTDLSYSYQEKEGPGHSIEFNNPNSEITVQFLGRDIPLFEVTNAGYPSVEAGIQRFDRSSDELSDLDILYVHDDDSFTGFGDYKGSFMWVMAGEVPEILSQADFDEQINSLKDSPASDLPGNLDYGPGAANWLLEGLIDKAQVNSIKGGEQSHSEVAVLSDGKFVVAWRSESSDGDGYGIAAKLFSATGVAVGSEMQVNETVAGDQTNVQVTALSNGGFATTWTSYGQDSDRGGVYAKIYDGSASVVAQEFHVNTTSTGNQGDYWDGLSLDQLSNGNIILAWSSDQNSNSSTDVYGKIISSTGSTVFDEFILNSTTVSVQEDPKVTATQDGGFIAVWQSYDPDGTYFDIQAQKFNVDGVAQGAEFTVNSETASQQLSPEITELTNSDYVVVWASAEQDTAKSYGIFGQLFDANGTAKGAEFQVNTYVEGRQDSPSIAALSDGGFVVSWNSVGQDGSNYGVYAQKFTSAGAKDGSETRLAENTEMNQMFASLDATDNGNFIASWHSNHDGVEYTPYDIYADIYNGDTLVADVV